MDNRSADTRLTDPVTTPFDDIRIAQQHYGREKNVETLPAMSQKTRSPWLFRLTAHAMSPVLSRLTARHEPRFYPAWRPTLPTNPGFIPLGTMPCPQTQRLSRLAGPVTTPLNGVWCRLIARMETLQATSLQQTGIYPVDEARIYASRRLRCQARPVLRWVGVSAAWLRVAASA